MEDPDISRQILHAAEEGAKSIAHSRLDVIEEAKGEIALRWRHSIHSGKPPTNPTAWAFVCSKNEAVRILRDRSRYEPLSEDIAKTLISSDLTEEAALIEKIDSPAIKCIDAAQAINGITTLIDITTVAIDQRGTDLDRRILKLHREQYSFVEIAAILGITETCARQRWYRLISTITADVMQTVRQDKTLAAIFSAILDDEDDFRTSILGLLSIIAAKGFPAITAAVHSIFA